MSDLLALAPMDEDTAALMWGAIQVQLYASVTGEPDQPTLDRLEALQEIAVDLRSDIIATWGRQSARRFQDHQFRATMGVPSRCAVAGCGLSPDVHTSSGGLTDALRGNMMARRERITRTTTNQPGRLSR